jgi:hypothetical protein
MTSEASPARPGLVSAAVACLALALAGTALVPGAGARQQARGAAAGSRQAAKADDPVVGEVLQMLRGGIAEPVIVHWLEKSGKRPAAVSSGDIVLLHQARASDNLLQVLVDAAAASSGQATAVPPPPAAPPAASPAAPPATPPAAAGLVKVDFLATYRPVDVDEGELVAERWLLCIYVDGRFVASVKQGPVLLPLAPQAFERGLAPGKHLLRITQERHLRYNSARGYKSPARVHPGEFPFELRAAGADTAAQITIRFGDKSFRHPGPVAVRVEQDGKELVSLEPAAPNPEQWPALCEDVPAALPQGAKPPAAARRDEANCLHWAALWPGIPAVPPRDEVRAEIAAAALAAK